eukprot:TRINITY_DN48357_c0_g1_i1.p1 TRINITY_DN48357_c0_g1~~TRINITY_DN48357_c0_g1_i1.p1  ORF type:complete len:446 (-),score=49.88 TRINITY_DN48357_c0_g1_i1:48-1385(-)
MHSREKYGSSLLDIAGHASFCCVDAIRVRTLTRSLPPRSARGSCTRGDAAASSGSCHRNLWTLAIGIALACVCCTLSGCDTEAHGTASWSESTSYWTDSSLYLHKTNSPSINSCGLVDIPKSDKCSGRGSCMKWNATSSFTLHFCKCSRDWADPECGTRRKSQFVAYFLSLCGGFLGFDCFYMGHYFAGIAKLSTLGGFGVWWIMDIVRVGSAPVYADRYRLAADLSHFQFVAFTICFAILLGYFVFDAFARLQRAIEKKSALLLTEDEFVALHSETIDTVHLDSEDNKSKKISYRSLIPIGSGGAAALGSYGATGKGVPQAVRVDRPNVPGGPYRNRIYFDAMGGMNPPSWGPRKDWTGQTVPEWSAHDGGVRLRSPQQSDEASQWETVQNPQNSFAASVIDEVSSPTWDEHSSKRPLHRYEPPRASQPHMSGVGTDSPQLPFA